MRIVAGSARGRKLVTAPGSATRPTGDRVREAMFNALFSLDAIDDATVCDLFAGSGALGLEALSRGAAHVTFVERDRHALDALRTNIDALGFGDRATVRPGDALRYLDGLGRQRAFDLVLADPPYDFEHWADVFGLVSADILVAESGDPLDEPPGWETLRQRRYGTTVVTILRSRPHPDRPPAGPPADRGAAPS